MLEPWRNPRSRFLWFRRRVPTEYRKFGLPAEIKFSLGTEDYKEALFRCNEHNIRLERDWRDMLQGPPADDLSNLQIPALAGEFYAETVAAHRDEPGPEKIWERNLGAITEVRSRRILTSQAWLNVVYGHEARAFLRRKRIALVGYRFEIFLRAFVDAKTRAASTLLENAQGNYSKEAEGGAADAYPAFDSPRDRVTLDELWPLYCRDKLLAPATAKKWRPYIEDVVRRVGSPDLRARRGAASACLAGRTAGRPGPLADRGEGRQRRRGEVVLRMSQAHEEAADRSRRRRLRRDQLEAQDDARQEDAGLHRRGGRAHPVDGACRTRQADVGRERRGAQMGALAVRLHLCIGSEF